MALAAEVRALRTIGPVLATLTFVLAVVAIIWAAGSTLGYDYGAYVRAGRRVVDGLPLYNSAFDSGNGFAVYLYPPPFALVAVPFALLPYSAGLWAWLATILAAFLVGAALLPVSSRVRWSVVALAALDWPFLYSVKLGQVGPLLFLTFAVGWRWIDRPARSGMSMAAGTIIKLQPAVLFGWALVSRRWSAVVGGLLAMGAVALLTSWILGPRVWLSYFDLLKGMGAPVSSTQSVDPGSIVRLLGGPPGLATAVELTSLLLTALVVFWAWLRADLVGGYLSTIVASQLLSPHLWDHYAMILLLPVAYLLERRQWWAIAIPLACWLPAPIYPVVFWICLVAPLVVAGPRPSAKRHAMA